MTNFEKLPRELFCLTLAHSIDDLETIERYLAEYPGDAESCMSIALRHALENKNLPIMPVPSAASTLEQLQLLWDPNLKIRTKINGAAKKGHTHLLAYLFSQGHQDLIKQIIYKLLIDAAKGGHADTVRFLLSPLWRDGVSKINMNQALENAAKGGYDAVVKLLLEHDADVNTYEGTPLLEATNNEHISTIKLLLEHKADINAQSGEVVISAVRSGKSEVVNFVLDQKADIHGSENVKFHYGGAIGWAATYGTMEIVKLLLERKANIHADGDTALVATAKEGRDEMINFLLDNGADIHAGEDAALKSAGRWHQLSTLKLLLARGANIRALIPLLDEMDTHVREHLPRRHPFSPHEQDWIEKIQNMMNEIRVVLAEHGIKSE